MLEFDNAFISYGRADSKAFAIKLYRDLSEKGLKIWFDQNDIPLGVDFQNQIYNGIEKADNFIFIISPHSVNSPYCLKEINHAVQHNKRIIPLLHIEAITYEIWRQRNSKSLEKEWEKYQEKGLHSCFQNMHPLVSKINWVYFRENIDNYEESLSGLLKLFSRDESYVRKHTELLVKALEWEQNQRQNRYLLTGQERQEADAWLKIRFTEKQPPCLPTDLQCEFICESSKNAHNLMCQVFLSFSDKNRLIMERFRRDLMRHSVTVWTNKADIKTGSEFQKEINGGIEGADNFVCLLSSDSLASQYCQQELSHALKLNKRTIFLLIESLDLEKVPQEIRNLQFLDLTAFDEEAEYGECFDKLLKILAEDAAYYEGHKTLLVKALKWSQQNRNFSILLRGYNLERYQSWLEVAKGRSLHPPTPLQIEFIAESAKQPPDLALDVFISYSRANADFARGLNDALQTQGKTTWFDQESIATGTDFQQEIYEGIEQSDNFLFIISPESINSPYCADEVEYAKGLNKRFVTVLHREVDSGNLHPELAKLQWLDFNKNGGDFYANFSELVRSLDSDRDYIRNQTKWSQRALEWEHKNNSTDLLLRGSELSLAKTWLEDAETNKKQPQPTALQKSYINKSDRLERRNRFLRRGIVAFVMGLVTATAIVSTAFWLRANKAAYRAETQVAITKGILAQNLLRTFPLKGLVQAIEATGQSKSSLGAVPKEVQSSLLEALQVAKEGTIESYILRGHQEKVRAVAASPDGRYIVSASKDGKLRLWNWQGNGIGEPFFGSEDEAIAVAFAPDGEAIASGSDDKTVRLWNLRGQPIGEPFVGHENTVSSVAFSPDGKYIASGSWDKTVRLWNREGKPVGEPFAEHEDGIISIAFSPDGKYIASASQDKTIRLWDLQGKSLGKPLVGHRGAVRSVAFSPDGKYIVSGGEDRTLRLWDLEGKAIGEPFEGHEDNVWSVAFSPDGEYIISAGWDNTIRLWNKEGKAIAPPLRGHEDVIWSVAFSPDGDYIASASSDETVRIWSRRPELPKLPLASQEQPITSVAFSVDGEIIATGSDDGTVRLWDKEGNSIGQPFIGHEATVWFLAFSPDGRYLASGSGDGTVRLWDLQGKAIATLTGHEGTVWSVAFSPDGKYISSGGDDKTVRLWDREGKAIGEPFVGHESAVTAIGFSPDGKYIVTGSSDRAVRVWDKQGNGIGKPFVGHEEAIYFLDVSPDGEYIVTVGSDRTARLWDWEGNSLAKPITEHRLPVYSVAISPDSNYIATVSEDKTVRLWYRDGYPLGNPFEGHTGPIYAVAFSPDGKYIVTGGNDKTVRLWDAGGWQSWLFAACDRLSTHSVLLEPQDEVARNAVRTCLTIHN